MFFWPLLHSDLGSRPTSHSFVLLIVAHHFTEFRDPNREKMLTYLDDAVREAHRKVESGRIYDVENEKVRIQWVRALAYAAGQYRQLLCDHELEEMNERLEHLEELQKDSNG